MQQCYTAAVACSSSSSGGRSSSDFYGTALQHAMYIAQEKCGYQRQCVHTTKGAVGQLVIQRNCKKLFGLSELHACCFSSFRAG
jgi:hypothetical protein